jgi:cell division septum initiation protein DivIVA
MRHAQRMREEVAMAADELEESPELESERALRRHERRLGHSLARLTAAQEAYRATRTQETKRALERAKVAHARLRKTHRQLQRSHQEEHDQQGGS